MFEQLERRQMLSSSPVYAPHAIVEGAPLQQWATRWWQKVFSIPVTTSDGKTTINPQLVDGKDAKALPSNGGHVVYLFGSFLPGAHDRTATVPVDTPIFIPVLDDEWSNPDTADPPDFTKLPGHYTAKQLSGFATVQTNTVNALHASLDGKAITNLFDHREASEIFSYTLPAKNNIDQVFFGETIKGTVHPVAADGYYLMLKPLSAGKHTLNVGGSSPDNSSVPPLLSAFSGDTTYHLTVVSKSKYLKSLEGTPFAPAATKKPSLFQQVSVIGDSVLD